MSYYFVVCGLFGFVGGCICWGDFCLQLGVLALPYQSLTFISSP